MMTIAELINILQIFPSDSEIKMDVSLGQKLDDGSDVFTADITHINVEGKIYLSNYEA